MNLSILQEHLHKALTRVSRAIANKPQLPVLQNILIQTGAGKVVFTATNLETTIVVSVPAKVVSEGAVCVSCRVLAELVSTIPEDAVILSVEKEHALTIRWGGGRATIPGVPVGEFPPVVIPSGDGMTLEKQTLLSAISRVLFAAATDDSRPLLTGIRIQKQQDAVLIAATDGYRLSLQRVVLDMQNVSQMVIPARALSEVVKVGSEEKDVSVVSLLQTDEKQLAFVVGDTSIITRLIDGEFPSFDRIIPKSHTTKVVVDSSAFARAVKSAAIFARDNANIIKLHIEKNALVVSANTPLVGENTIEVEVATEGDGGDIAFNCRFLQEFLANYHEDTFVFEMTGSLNPGAFHPENDDSYLHIIMPVRVQS